MAFAGVLVSDQELQGQFTQVELRSLKSKFLHIKSDTGKVTVGTLAPEMTKIKALETLTQNEVWTILCHHYPDSQRELDFEDFLWVYLHLHNKTTMKKGATRRSSSFLKTATTTLLHTIDESEKSAYVSHINSCFELDPIMKRYLPIEPSTNELFDLAKDGVLLCKLINLAVPGTIDERTINTKKILNPWERNENHTLCLNSAKAIGCTVVNIGTQDLAEGTPHLVLALISQIIKIQLLSDLDLKKTPELVELVDDSKEVEELMNLAPEKVLLRWVNFHLKKVGYKRVVTNFSSDLKDGEAYTYLLNALAPEYCNLSPLESKDLMERAKLVLLQAEKINCRRYLTPKDIVQGSPNLNLAFVAHLFHQRKGLSLDSSKASIAETAQNDEVSKEEKAFRYWINSLGIDSVISSSFEDVRDGWVLLEVLDKVEPGCVNWKHASRPPIKMPFKKVENCNQVIKIGKQMKFSLVNVAGNDFVQGNKKLILAFLWQLMRHNILQLLKNLKHHSRGKEITDSDILHWANSQVKKIGRESRMTSFKDKSLSSGIFFLELLTAVEPRAVSWGIVTKGVTEEEKKLNATYTISITRKLGCSVFLLPEDIIEVNPKMIMTLTASIMLWSYSNQSGDDTSSVTSDIENGVASASLSDEEGGAPHIASSLDAPHVAPSADFDALHVAPLADATIVAPSDDATTVPSSADVTPLASSADNGDDGFILKDSISVNNGNEEASISADNGSDDRSSPNIVESAEITNVGGVSEASVAVDNLNEDSNESKDSSAIQSDTETQLHNE